MKKIIFTLGIISLFIFGIQAQEKTVETEKNKETKSAFVKIKEGAKTIVYIDDKLYDSDILDLLDQDKIATIDVFKEEMAMKKYQAENVIVIRTKKNISDNGLDIDRQSQSKEESRIYIGSGDVKNDADYPVIVIDGKKQNKEYLRKLSPDDIKEINVFKDKKSKKKYKTDVGVIKVTTKKGNK